MDPVYRAVSGTELVAFGPHLPDVMAAARARMIDSDVADVVIWRTEDGRSHIAALLFATADAVKCLLA